MTTAKSVHVQVSLLAALGFHEAFRRLGYPPHAIYIAVHPAAELAGGVVPWIILKSPLLPRPALMTLSPVAFSDEEQSEFLELWPKIAVEWNETMTDEERRAIWRDSYVANNTVAFVKKMIELGHREPIRTEVLA